MSYPELERVSNLKQKIQNQKFHLPGGQVVTVTGWGNSPEAPKQGSDSRLFIPTFSNGKSLMLLVSDTTLALDRSGAYQAKLIQCMEGWLLREDPSEQVECYE